MKAAVRHHAQHRARRIPRRAAFALLGAALLVTSAPGRSPAREPAVLPLPAQRRPLFTLPPLDDPAFLGSGMLDATRLAETAGIDSASLLGGSAMRWAQGLPPLFPDPVRSTRDRDRWCLGAGTGPGGNAGLERALGDGLRLRIAGDAWGGRIPDRSHGRTSAQLAAGDAAPVPAWRGGLALNVLKEGWDGSTPRRALPGSMWMTALSGDLQRAVHAGASRVVLGLDAAWAQVRARACPSGECGSGAEIARTGRWRSIGVGARTAGTARDLRRYAAGDGSRSPRADLEFWGGLAHRRSPEGVGQSVGRWRSQAVWTWPHGVWHLAAGWGASGESRHACLGPILGLRRTWLEPRLCAAVELAPELRFAEEALALPERLPEVSLIREAPRASFEPRTPILCDPRLAPQRAWPRLAGEVLRESDAGWWDLTLVVAHLRDPLDWRADTLAEGTPLLRTASGASRLLARVTLTVERRLGAGLALTARYRGIRDARAGDPARALHALPPHRLEARLESAGRRWRWGLAVEARGRAPAASGTAAPPATIVIGAHAGLVRDWGALRVVTENLGAAGACDEPYAPILRRWVGLEWNLLERASVP